MKALSTTRLSLRPIREADAEALIEIYDDPEVGRYMTEQPHTIEHERARIREYRQTAPATGFGWTIWRKDGGELIGRCGLFVEHYDDVKEIGLSYVIARDYRGNGYATEAVQRVVAYAGEELGTYRIVAGIVPGNSKSIRVAEKLGMSFDRISSAGELGQLLVYCTDTRDQFRLD